MTGRAVLYSSVAIAPLAWIAVVLFTHFVPPVGAMTFTLLFVLLGVALTSTLTPIAYGIGLRLLTSHAYRATILHAVRQGVLLSFAIILNLLLLSLRSWNIFMGLIILVATIIVEVLFLARK
ncbi:MAG: hypothetical protein NVS4B12_24030 [Ktedonobacteraceae bacterium]